MGRNQAKLEEAEDEKLKSHNDARPEEMQRSVRQQRRWTTEEQACGRRYPTTVQQDSTKHR